MNRYAIGLDMGITSVGWATVALDDDDRPICIIDMGSRIFDAAEQPKTGDSLAAPRREARGARRRLRRRRHRNERIRNLIVSSDLLSKEQLAELFSGNLSDIYELRAAALDRALSREEFARVLIHISQKRGFKSNRKSASGDKEEGKLLEAITANEKRMKDNGYRTVGEMLYKYPEFAEQKRNKGGEYKTTVSRAMVEAEVRTIFDAQRAFGADFAGQDFEESYLSILLSQRSFDEGPGTGSPYGGDMIEKMIGFCTFEPDKKRAAKATYSFELFNLLQRINHIRIITGGKTEALTAEQRAQIRELAHKTESLNYARIRKELGISGESIFNIDYKSGKTAEETEKDEKFNYLNAYHKMRKALDKIKKGRINELSTAQKNAIGDTLSKYKTDEKIRPPLEKAGLGKDEINAVSSLNFRKFGHLSLEACDKINVFLEEGLTYNEACEKAGYNFRSHSGNEKQRLLPPLDPDQNEITSPVVLRTIAQTRKIINSIIREYDRSPVYINIELAREMSKDFDERKNIKKQNDDNRARNERIKEKLRETYGILNPTGLDIIKLRLAEEQDFKCAYSQKPLELSKLFSPGYAEVDHIFPYSISFDDSYKNKVIVLAKENRDKGNSLPLQYLT